MLAEISRQMLEAHLSAISVVVEDSRQLERLTDLCRNHGWSLSKGSLYSWLEIGFTRGAESTLVEELQEEEPPFAVPAEPILKSVLPVPGSVTPDEEEVDDA